MIRIHRYVIHELVKKARMTTASAVFSNSLGNPDEISKRLVEETYMSFNNNPGLKNTGFVDRNDKVFKNDLLQYLSSFSDQDFYDFTVNSLTELESEIIKEPLATGGFYLFADYEVDSKRFILVVLLRKKDGLNLKRINNVYVVDPTENLNIDKIAMGFRLNLNIYQSDNDDRNYLALVTHQKDKISDYFKDWVVAGDIIGNDKNTRSLINIVKRIPIPQNEDGTEAYDRESFQKEVYNFIDSHPKKIVNLSNLSAHFYGEENSERVIDYANANSIIIDNEFKRSSSVIKGLITIRAKADGIDLKVDYDKLNENEVDVQDDMIIIRVPEILNQVKEQNS